jgi:hypothetical protein
MALPLTNRDPGAADRMMGGSAVTTATCVHEALAHLRRTGQPAAVVYRNGRPVGVVTAAALARARNTARRDVPLTVFMDYVAVPVDPHADALKTPAQVAVYGGIAGQQFDPCYHMACDTFANNSNEVLDLNSDAIAFATLTYAMSTETVTGAAAA